MLALVAPRQFQIFVRRLARFLYESVKQNHAIFPVDVKQHPCNSVLSQTRPDFTNGLAQRLADGHSDRPAEFDGLDVFADALPVFG